jgi:hypothetical protein
VTAVELPLLWTLVSLLVASQLPTSGAVIGEGVFHPASNRVFMDCRFVAAAANLVGTRQPGEKEGSSKIGHAWPPAKQEKRSVRQKWLAALQAAHPSHDGLRMPDLEIRCPRPCQKAASATIQVSSHCYQRNLVRW